MERWKGDDSGIQGTSQVLRLCTRFPYKALSLSINPEVPWWLVRMWSLVQLAGGHGCKRCATLHDHSLVVCISYTKYNTKCSSACFQLNSSFLVAGLDGEVLFDSLQYVRSSLEVLCSM
jgi:hypothetical protein